MRKRPYYNMSSNYQTNAKSIMDYLAKSNKFLEMLIEDYEVFQETIVAEMKQSKFDAEMSVEDILLNWLDDGTLERIINDEVFGNKADKADLIVLEQDIRQALDEFLINAQEQINAMDGRIKKYVFIKDYPVDPSGQLDSLAGFQQAFNDMSSHDELILHKNATYLLSDTLQVDKAGVYTVYGNGSHILSNVSNNKDGLSFRGLQIQELNPINTIKEGSNEIAFSNVANLKTGDLLYFTSNDQYNSSRSYYKKGGVFTVINIDQMNNVVTFSGNFPYDIDNSLRVYAYDPMTLRMTDLSIEGLNTLPNGRWGIGMEFNANSKLSNVISDNFNHCITSRYSYSPLFEHVKTKRSLFNGTTESYGLSIYVNSFAHIKNSDMHSGRHGFEVSGFENSFKTKIENSSVFAENHEFDLNTHQCSHDIVIDNVITGTVGLCGHSTLSNSQIGREGECHSQIKSSQTHDLSQFIIQNNRIIGEHWFEFRSDQSTDNPSRFFGDFVLQDNEVIGKIRLSISLSSHRFNINRIKIDNTDHVATVAYYGTTVNNFIHTDSRYSWAGVEFLRMANDATINNYTARNLVLYIPDNNFEFMALKNYNRVILDSLSIGSVGTNRNHMYLSQPDESITNDRVFISNIDLMNVNIKAREMSTLALSNCYNEQIDGLASVDNYYPPNPAQ